MGLSMGGALVLRLAEERGDAVTGVVVVNASVASESRLGKLIPLLSKVLKSTKGVGSDIKKPGVTELAYDKVPLKAATSLFSALPVVCGDLARITAPVLVFRSSVDHVVEPISGRKLMEGLAGETVQERVLENSYHVATLDNDAPIIFEESLQFVRTLAPALEA